mgnify:CR=1 FL=1
MQVQALKNLEETRKENDRALLISATGTGKTYLSAFDVKQAKAKKILFVAHRKVILERSKISYQRILKNKNMEIFDTNFQINNKDEVVFAMVQTLNKEKNLNIFPKDYFDYIIIDEVHHGGAKTYQSIFEYFKPKFLLGITATPERTDDFNIYQLFNYNVAYEIRLQDAMKEELLCPFHYFGISDIVIDGESINEKTSLKKLTSDTRVKHILEKSKYYSYSGERLSCLIFVSKVEEAKILVEKFLEQGIKAIALSSENSDNEREEAIRKLEQGEIEYIISVDIFNEGVDIPCVNQVILLRPTTSAIVYIQQLGRGLRKHKNKDYTVVLDFIGNYEKNFLIPIAISQNNSYDKDFMKRFLMNATDFLAGESSISFDEISKERIFENINKTNFSNRKLIEEDFKLLEKAEALDDKTVKFTFSAPSSTFIYNAANLGIVAEHAYKDTNTYSLNPIGSGPYKVVSYTQGQQLILDRNEEYYGTKPKFKRLTLVTMTPDTALASIKAGDIDIVNVSEAMAQEKIENYSILATKTMDFRAISMPVIKKSEKLTEKGNPMGNDVTSDIAIRKAINYGVDRQEIIENVLYGYGEVIFDFFDSLPWGIKDEIRKEFKNGDIAKANEILDKAGWKMKDDGIREKDGVKAEFRLLYPASDDTRQSCAEAFAVQCKKIGINVIPEGSDWTEMEKRQSSDACVIGGGQYTPEAVARFYFSERIGGPWSNIVRENNPTVDEHIRAAYLATDEKVAIKNWQKALWDGKEGGSVLGDAPYCTICYLEHLYFVRDGLDLGRQKLHTHARDLSLMANIEEWDFKK